MEEYGKWGLEIENLKFEKMTSVSEVNNIFDNI